MGLIPEVVRAGLRERPASTVARMASAVVGAIASVVGIAVVFGLWPSVATAVGVTVVLTWIVLLAKMEESRDSALLAEARSGSLVKELRAVQRLVDSISLRDIASVDEDLRIIHWIGRTGDEDREQRFFTTTVKSGIVPWRVLTIGGSTPLASFSTLNLTVGPSPDVEFVSLSEQARLRGVARFSPALRPGDVREWTVEFGWPGVWDQLRSQGHDNAEFAQMIEGASSFEIMFVFPHGAHDVRLDSEPELGTSENLTYEARPAIRWMLDRPPHGVYRFVLGMKPL